MTAEEGGADGGAGEGRTIMVGVQIDGNGRDLLDWALGRVARRGDRVVAVHVSRGSCGAASSPLSLIKSLDDYLAEYDGVCNLKQVVLVGRVSRGNSIRKTLVKEAKLCSAMAVVVGVNKNNHFGGTISVARYCAKKLPPTTSLFAVHNGKVFLEREASQPPPGREQKTTLGSMLHPNLRMGAMAVVPADKAKPETAVSRAPDGGPLEEGQGRQEVEGDACEWKPGAEPGSLTLLVRKLPETATPGWPLLRRLAAPNREDDARKMSVVQWVMSLPSRSSPPEAAPDGASSPAAPVDLRAELEAVLEKNSCSCRWFGHTELDDYTDHFSSENLIGKGGSSRVYRGSLPNGERVAVKTTKLTAAASRDFLSEVDIITSLQHKNVVPLLGIGVEDGSLVSVYRFFSKGSLEENLHGERAKRPMPWDSRFKVAIGIAEALHHLHTSSPRPIIHRDVKSSNILLSDDFEPQLTDFGLALWAPTTSSYATHSDVLGTFGYLAPEYFMYGKVSHKMDVYAFGVVLLELVTGRRTISDDYSKEGQGSLVMWATLVLERGEVTHLLDPNLDANYDEEQVHRVVFAASLCLRRSARLRPPMSEILKLLRGEEDVETWMGSHGGCAGEGAEGQQDEEVYPPSSVASHIGLALLDVDDTASVSSVEQSYQGSLEDYLKGRWSRSSSFD
uniref:Receptor-like cytosolic serine/threonine-protein kinase RBK2 n=1 Tax=Anthurium amnicola TaxID=1678845 RepID=A0A1D1XH75_9ARAE